MKKRIYYLFGYLLLTYALSGQVKSGGKALYEIRTIAFYNLENLFDTKNDSLVFDDDRTPEGKDRWTENRLQKKLVDLSRVVNDLGKEYGANPPDLLGVCEVENRKVLEQLIRQPDLLAYNLGIIHYESPDPRGIDVALIYRKGRFFPENSRSFRLLIYDKDGKRKYIRDQLLVKGFLGQDPVYVFVNHWPSRGGSQALTQHYRRSAALRQRSLIDSLLYRNPEARIISMGDFNDNPVDKSMKILSRVTGIEDTRYASSLLNPMERLYRKGAGSLAYRDRWNLFDQILFSQTWLDTETPGSQFWKARVFLPKYLKTSKGRYKGYPFRTYAGGYYQGGYSDHYPVYAYLIEPIEPDTN